MPKYDLVLFDLDGTLTDSQEGIVNSIQFALRHFGIEINAPEELRKFLGPPLWNSFKEFCGFDEEQIKVAVDKYREYYLPKGIFENNPYLGIAEILELLKFHGVILAVATSKPTIQAERILNHFNISTYFDLIVGSEMDGTRSDKAEIIAYVLDKLDSGRKMKAVMIGDRKHDIIGANAHRIDSIGVLWGYGDRAELEATNATYIIESTNEIPNIICGV
ncbi:MAG: HAD family hydrolase [Defluviitaleaceae bacterium]|nr:HAD family hydrolase [Defluviitaleaceae bacterium]